MRTDNRAIYQHYKHNFWVNLFDGGFFGMALGFASFITVIPLFVSSLTSSAILIGLIPAIHNMGWQLPQLFTAHRVTHLRRFKPMTLAMTIHERLPFFGLAIVAWFLPRLHPQVALGIIFILLIWQGLGGGFTATAWQSMIAKIIPSERRGTFLGFQASSANLFSSIGALLAGLILLRWNSSQGYALCFVLASLAMITSFGFLASTHEPESASIENPIDRIAFRRSLITILHRDHNFRWFLLVRMLSMFGMMAFAFYTVYAVRFLGMNEAIAGVMMSIYTAGQIVVNPLMGWVGDRWSHPAVLKIGALATMLSALIAAWAPNLVWFYLIFILAGVATATISTIGVTMTLEFGQESERPAYIGLANTLIAPATILAPLLGGWLADSVGYQATFLVAAVSGFGATLLLQTTVRDPRRILKDDLREPFTGVEVAEIDIDEHGEVL